MLRTLRSNLWWVLWLLFVVAGSTYLERKGERVSPELIQRGKLLSLLERSVAAARLHLSRDSVESADRSLVRALLDHGVRAEVVASDDKGTPRRLRIGSGDIEGWIEIFDDGRRPIVHAWFDLPARRLELRARIPQGDRP